MTAPRNRRRVAPAPTDRALPWVSLACASLLLAALTRGWWAVAAVLVGLVAVVVLGALASEQRPPQASERPLEATETGVRDRRTGQLVPLLDEEGEPWTG